MKRSVVSAAVAVATGFAVAPAGAMPPNGLVGMNVSKPTIEHVRHRCYLDEDGHRHCPSHNVRPYSYSYSSGYAPGFSLYIGRDRGWNGGPRWRGDRDDWRRPLSLRERR